MKYLVIITLFLIGCSSNPTLSQRQDKILADPMNYSPNVSEHTNISGGGLTDLKKDSLKRDFNSVFNP